MGYGRLGGFGRDFGSLGRVIAAVQAVLVPVNTVLPAITGTAQEGQTLSASTGTWTNSPTGYSYQWAAGGVAIVGAINSTRTLTSAEIGKVITCAVTATNVSGAASAASAATSAVIAAALPVPANTVAPVVSGTPAVGYTLSTTNGTWSNSPTGYAYQWRRDGVNIASATASTYVVVSADLSAAITCRVTAANAGGSGIAVSNGLTVQAGNAATTLPTPASVHFHPNTATMTFLGGDVQVTFTASIGNNTITVAGVTGGSLLPGMVIQDNAHFFDGARVLTQATGTAGGAGTYTVTPSSVTANATGVTKTFSGAAVVTSISDKTGRWSAVPIVTGWGPILETDTLGIKRLMFGQRDMGAEQAFAMKVAGPTGIDSHRMAWFAAVTAPVGLPGVLVSPGVAGASPPAITLLGIGSSANPNNAPFVSTFRRFFQEQASWTFAGSAVNRMLAHAGLQIIGVSVSCITDLNSSTTSSNTYARHYHNGDCTHVDNVAVTRNISMADFSIGHQASSSGGGSNEAAFMGHLYELVGCWEGQLAGGATGAAIPAAEATAADAVVATMVANWKVATLTENRIIVGDSRTARSELTCKTIGYFLTDRGSTSALPTNYRVLTDGYPGKGAAAIYADVLNPFGRFAPNLLYGSGHDKALFMHGANDLGTATAGNWPSNLTTGATTQRADEVFNMGGGLYNQDAVFTGSATNQTITVEGITSGLINQYGAVAYSGGPTGLTWGQLTGNFSLGTGAYITNRVSINAASLSAPSGTAMTQKWGTRVRIVQAALDLGINVVQLIEPMYTNTANDTTTNQLRNHDLNDLAGLVTPQSGRTFGTLDLRQIQVGGKFIFGSDWLATQATNYVDGIHQTDLARGLLVSGGDTPAYGYRAAAL